MTPSMSYQPHHQSVHAHHHPHQQYQHHQQQHQQQDVDFSPLTSPAIMPQPSGDMTPGQIYEQYEQLERAKMMITRRLSELQRKRPREEAIREYSHTRLLHALVYLTRPFFPFKSSTTTTTTAAATVSSFTRAAVSSCSTTPSSAVNTSTTATATTNIIIGQSTIVTSRVALYRTCDTIIVDEYQVASKWATT